MMKRCWIPLLVGLALPVTAWGETLQLPADATLDVHVIERQELTRESAEITDILLQPINTPQASHQLPEHCLITADATLNADRVRLRAKTLTCVDAKNGESVIFSDELSASASESDGSYGVDACRSNADGQCSRALLTPDHVFQMRLGKAVSIERQDNPAAKINEARRQANGEGRDNPVPREESDPERP